MSYKMSFFVRPKSRISTKILIVVQLVKVFILQRDKYVLISELYVTVDLFHRKIRVLLM